MDIEIYKAQNSFYFEYKNEISHFNHKISYPFDLNASDDALLAAAIFTRPINAEIFNIAGVTCSSAQILRIESIVKAKINCRETQYNQSKPISAAYLTAFSGGFDSLALKSLLPSGEYLASINFGGYFEREAKFFRKHTDIIIESNIRTKKFNDRNFNEKLDWRFLTAPLLLLGTNLVPVVIRAGTILESSPFWFANNATKEFHDYSKNVYGETAFYSCPISCISEYATTKIVNETYARDEVACSLTSLADERSFKTFRKEVLLAMCRAETPPILKKNLQKHLFGSSFGDDMVALYINWKMGSDWTRKNYCEIPENLIGLNFEFFEKINNYSLQALDPLTRDLIFKKLIDYGLSIYDQVDYSNASFAINEYKQSKF